MKKILIAITCLLFTKAALAQKELLPFDENNKYIYYQVVDELGLTADTLHTRGLYFLKMAYPALKVKQDKTNATVAGSGKFMVYNNALALLKHVDGEIRFTYTIESKDQKFRYWLTNFIFTPYKNDRYGKSVPTPGVEIPLESGASKLDRKQADNYLDQSGTYSKQFGDKLKEYMIRTSGMAPKKAEKKVISTKDW